MTPLTSDKRYCGGCGTMKPRDKFSPKGTWCRACDAVAKKHRYNTDPKVRARKKKMGAAQHAALRRLREKYREDYDQFYDEELRKRGIR